MVERLNKKERKKEQEVMEVEGTVVIAVERWGGRGGGGERGTDGDGRRLGLGWGTHGTVHR